MASRPAPTAPAPGPSAVVLDLPVAPADAALVAFGLNPFGIHFGGTSSSGHGLDGHPGWDVEIRVGGAVRAAADGVIQSLFADSFMPDRFTIQIQHPDAQGRYRTVYTNVNAPAAGILAGARVARGQPLGTAGSQTIIVGSRPVTYAMTHFQFDDFSRLEGLTNPNAVSPGEALSAAGQELFDTIWTRASYGVEISEPFPSNPRNVSFPFTRTWTRTGGALPAALAVVRLDAATTAHDYVWTDETGSVTERGSLTILASGEDLALDFRPAGVGPLRLGRADIVGSQMRIALGGPGEPRPATLEAAAVYTTR